MIFHGQGDLSAAELWLRRAEAAGVEADAVRMPGWMVYCMENPIYKWMMTGGTPIFLGNLSRIFEGSLEVKLPTIWTDEKQSKEEAERRERLEERRVEEKE